MSPKLGFGDICSLEAGERKQLGNFGFLQRAIELGDGDLFAGEHLAVEDAGNGEASEVVAVIEIRDENL